MAVGEDIEGGELILVLALVIGGGIGLYYILNKLGISPGAPDPGGGAPATGILGAVVNQLEVGSSSLSFSDALQSIVTSPLQAIESILGFGGGASDTGGDSSPGSDTDYSSVTG
jgi:hypothetical protein